MLINGWCSFEMHATEMMWPVHFATIIDFRPKQMCAAAAAANTSSTTSTAAVQYLCHTVPLHREMVIITIDCQKQFRNQEKEPE